MIRRLLSMLSLLTAQLFAIHHAETQQPGLADFWSGSAAFNSPQAASAPFPDFHFLSHVWHGSQLRAYYVSPYETFFGEALFDVALATSTNGINWTPVEKVLTTDGRWQNEFNGFPGFSHNVGRADFSCGYGWSANTAQDAPGYLAYNAIAYNLSGQQSAGFALWIDQPNGSNDWIANLDVYNKTTNTVLQSRLVRRNDFHQTEPETIFNLAFNAVPGHQIELRVYYFDNSYLCLRAAGTHPGVQPFLADKTSSFASVWKDGATWYMVYEGSSRNLANKGDVRLATSSNGVSWQKHPTPLIQPYATWNQTNVGTPSLYKSGNTWYLYFHGYNEVTGKLNIGLATGTNLFNLALHNGGAPLFPSSTGWNSGTVAGFRSIKQDGPFYYMVFEGSTDSPSRTFEESRWSSGLARSMDLKNWTLFSGNPILPQTASDFGYDGPEFIQTPNGQTRLYYRRYNASKANFTELRTLNWTLPPVNRVTKKANSISREKSDLVVWRPSNGTWYINTADSNYNPAQSHAIQLGLPGDKPMMGDIDGDSVDDLVVWRPSNGTWYYRLSSELFSVIRSQQWGLSTDIPLMGDFDGDGADDFIVYRNGSWYIRYQSGVQEVRIFGGAGDKPMSGDFDGDGKSDLAVWSTNNYWYVAPSTGGLLATLWGNQSQGHIGKAADFDGNGKADVGFWNPADGTWYYRDLTLPLYWTVQWGLPGDKPVYGDSNGDALIDTTVWRSSGAPHFYIFDRFSTTKVVQWGLQGDIIPEVFE